MSSSPSRPLAGRRIWIAGIGGAGMSGYALLAHAWGAEVAGWDRVETPYLRHLEGIALEISPEPPAPPSGWEVFVSTAFAGRVEGRPRADLLAELVAQRRAIVVAGAHGKTTTSAMIAFCLDRLGLAADARVVLVFGGSLGARLLNDLALDAWADDGPAVIHLCGERDYPELRRRASRPDYILQPFIDQIGIAYGAADVVLARAGGSVWELAAAGLPAVLVPGAFATGQHQEKNARWFADAGGAVIVPEAEAARAPRVVEELLGEADRLAAMAAAMRAVAKPDAAEEIADELISLAESTRR